VSYALVMRVQQPVKVGDRFSQPDDQSPRPASAVVPTLPAPAVSAPAAAPTSQRR
jgi:hypothetical protein